MSVQDICGRSCILTFLYDVSSRCVSSALAHLTSSWFFSVLKQNISPLDFIFIDTIKIQNNTVTDLYLTYFGV